jgi:hypothetical protein
LTECKSKLTPVEPPLPPKNETNVTVNKTISCSYSYCVDGVLNTTTYDYNGDVCPDAVASENCGGVVDQQSLWDKFLAIFDFQNAPAQSYGIIALMGIILIGTIYLVVPEKAWKKVFGK